MDTPTPAVIPTPISEAPDDSINVPTVTAIPTRFSEAPAPSTSKPSHQIDEARLSEGFFCICGQQAIHKIALHMHVRYYTCQRNFVCTECTRKYPNLGDLKAHMKSVHHILSEKTNGCRDCGACFDTRKELFYHLADIQ